MRQMPLLSENSRSVRGTTRRVLGYDFPPKETDRRRRSRTLRLHIPFVDSGPQNTPYASSLRRIRPPWPRRRKRPRRGSAVRASTNFDNRTRPSPSSPRFVRSRACRIRQSRSSSLQDNLGSSGCNCRRLGTGRMLAVGNLEPRRVRAFETGIFYAYASRAFNRARRGEPVLTRRC